MATPLDFALKKRVAQKNSSSLLFSPVVSPAALWSGSQLVENPPLFYRGTRESYGHALPTKQTSPGVPESLLSLKAGGGLALRYARRAFTAGVVLQSNRGASVLLQGKQNLWSAALNLANRAFSNSLLSKHTELFTSLIC